MSNNRIFREELPGEKKTIVQLLMTGYIVTISCLGYVAFYIFIQLGQVERIVDTLNPETQDPEKIGLLKERMNKTTHRLQTEVVGLAILGSIISIIGGLYTINLVVKPLRRLVDFAESDGKSELPEVKSNTEIKQLATSISALTSRLSGQETKVET
jgi:methyl-accepting chemotaxis protein